MRRLIATAVTGLALFGGVNVAEAHVRSCGTVLGWSVYSERTTTTCGLAHSAGRNFVRQVNAGSSRPRKIRGYSPRTGRWYTLRAAGGASTAYHGRAGSAVLVVYISGTY